MSSVANGAVTNYVVNKNRDYAQVLEEKDGAGSLIVSYIYGDDLISQKRGSSVSYYHYDGLGSTKALTDEAANVTDTYVYEAFGELLTSSGTTENSYFFTGEQYDANIGFYYLRARYYDINTGRFITTDPWKGNIYAPLSIHKYLYAADNPVMFIDPTGKCNMNEKLSEIEIAGIITITTGLIIKAIQERTNTGTKTKSNNKNTITLYRGVHGKHARLYEARMGIAIPWSYDNPGAHNDPELHNDGETQSIFTSWSIYQDVAEKKADLYTNDGFPGVVLKKEFNKNDPRIVNTLDKHQEGEVLIIGPVYNAEVIHQ